MFRKLLEHHITLIVAILACVIVAGGAAYYLFKPQPKELSVAQALIMNIQETITADGKVDSDKHVSLSFNKAGTITSVNVKVGDTVKAGQVLASEDSAQLRASLAAAKADVLSAQANLTSLQKGATTQTRAVYQQNISTTKLALATAVKDAYQKVQDALLNKLGNLFANNTSANPTITIPTETSIVSQYINSLRLDMTTRLANWNDFMMSDPTSIQTITEATNDIAAAHSFMDAMAVIVNRLNPGNSGMSTTDISTDVNAVGNASTEITSAETEFNSALQAYKTANDQLSVITASSTPETIQIAQAALAKAQANVSSIQSQIDDTILTAPWNGVVASINPKVGENFAANTPAVDIISSGAYKIDVMVPENEIAAIGVNNEADITFDAYGPTIDATGTVASIDLSPTVTGNVSAYKATVYLNSSDPRIRTGMTGNVTIHGAEVDNVVAVPSSAVITTPSGSYVFIENQPGSFIEQPVKTGVEGNGWTEITSGVKQGNTIAAFGLTGQ